MMDFEEAPIHATGEPSHIVPIVRGVTTSLTSQQQTSNFQAATLPIHKKTTLKRKWVKKATVVPSFGEKSAGNCTASARGNHPKLPSTFAYA